MFFVVHTYSCNWRSSCWIIMRHISCYVYRLSYEEEGRRILRIGWNETNSSDQSLHENKQPSWVLRVVCRRISLYVLFIYIVYILYYKRRIVIEMRKHDQFIILPIIYPFIFAHNYILSPSHTYILPFSPSWLIDAPYENMKKNK